MIAYLDTNVFDHLYKKIGCTSADIADLRKAVYGHTLSMPIGIHVLEELLLNRKASPQELVARVKLTLSIASIRRMVKPCDQLIADDLRSYAATGQPDRPLVSAQIQNAITQGIAELIESDGEEFSEEIAEALEETRQRKERYLQGTNVLLGEITSQLESVPANTSFDDYFQRFAISVAERFAHRAGVLDACRDRGLEGLLEIRSVRAVVGIALSIVYGQAFEGWTDVSTDSSFFLHVPSAAATAEVFVTDDARLRHSLKRVPFENFQVMSLPEFLAACGANADPD
jgi:hypothetical protein